MRISSHIYYMIFMYISMDVTDNTKCLPVHIHYFY
jgi:hypothetical protein